MPRAPPPLPEVVAEYAKSGRSSCKGCGSSIAVGVLRVGLSTKDPRGWDAVKWHHIACFPRQPLGAADQIKGFPELKESDQEALKKLEAENADLPVPELSQPAKATKSIEKVVSVSAVKDKFKVIVEYAKSNQSSCKGCGEVMTAGSPRLGLSNKDTRGFDFVKWYHLTYFPVGTMALGSAEEINGFSLLKDCDKDTITKLEAAVPANQSNKEDDNLHDSEKIAAFDFDGCLANTSVKKSFYVGDAAGRANDHSDADIKFAQDIGLKFHVPEEFFGLLDDSK